MSSLQKQEGGEKDVTGGWGRETYDRLVGLFYLAITEPASWTEALRLIAEGLQAAPVAVHVHGINLTPATTIGSWGVRPKLTLSPYENYYAERNIWLLRGGHLLTPGAVLTGEELCSDEEFLRSEYYNDFLRPLDVRYSIRAVLTNSPEPLSYLSAGRPHGAQPFGETQRRKLSALIPHLTQSVRIQERLETLQARRRAAAGALERVPLGVFFLDARGRVVEMNAAAKKLVDAKDGLKIDRGTLMAIDTRADVQLQRLIFGASAADSSPTLQRGGAFSLSRGADHFPLSVMVAPTGAAGLFPAARLASVIVLVEEPVRRDLAPFDSFTGDFGLSPAEALLTARLVGGMSITQAAVANGIQPSTARSHLKRIFVKTGAKRQSDLVRRVLTYEEGGSAAKKKSRTNSFEV